MNIFIYVYKIKRDVKYLNILFIVFILLISFIIILIGIDIIDISVIILIGREEIFIFIYKNSKFIIFIV